MELHCVGIHAVPFVAFLFTLEANLHIEIEQDGQIRDKPARSIMHQYADLFQVLLMTVALVGNGRVVVAV